MGNLVHVDCGNGIEYEYIEYEYEYWDTMGANTPLLEHLLSIYAHS